MRTRRLRPEDLDVTPSQATTSAGSWPPPDRGRSGSRSASSATSARAARDRAAAALDYDQLHKRLRFAEKGGKTIWKPVPGELDDLILAALASGVYSDTLELLADADHSANPYLIPPEAKLHKVDRDDRIVWAIVKRVAGRAGVEAHVHALRAEFASPTSSVNATCSGCRRSSATRSSTRRASI
jgi:hypothetical protein